MDILIAHWHCILPIAIIGILILMSLSESRKEKQKTQEKSENSTN